MSRYDGLIIPRSYSEYINKTDAATLQQALQLSGVLSGAVAAGDNKAVKSSAVNAELSKYRGVLEKTVTINHGDNVHTLVTLETRGTYLLHASGNNYGGYLGFVTNGYDTRTVIKELYHVSISAVVSGFKTLDFKSYANGDIELSIVRF